MSRSGSARRLAIILLVTFALGGCGGSAPAGPALDGSTGSATTPVSIAGTGGVVSVDGQVTLADPVPFALVTAVDASGRVLAGPTKTDDHGLFNLRLPSQTADFRVVAAVAPTVTAARTARSTAALGAHLSSEVEVSASSAPFVQVGPLTTLVSRIRVAQPHLSRAQCEATAGRYLQLPAGYPLRAACTANPPLCSLPALLAQADAAGGLDVFEDVMATEALAGQTRAFALMAASGGIGPSDVGIFVGRSLAGGVISTVANGLFGMALQALGVDFGTSGALADLKSELSEISSQITALQQQVAQLGQQLDADFQNLTYTTLISNLVTGNGTGAQITALNQQLSGYAQQAASGTPVDPSLLATLEQSIENSLGYQDVLEQFQVGSQALGLPSAMLALQTIVAPQFICNTVQGQILGDQFLQIRQLHGIQLNLTTSMYTSAVPPSVGLAYGELKKYYDHVQQEQSFLPHLPDDAVIYDHTHNLLWIRAMAGPMSFYQAQSWASAQVYGPFHGFTLPTRAQVRSLAKASPIDTLNPIGFSIPSTVTVNLPYQGLDNGTPYYISNYPTTVWTSESAGTQDFGDGPEPAMWTVNLQDYFSGNQMSLYPEPIDETPQVTMCVLGVMDLSVTPSPWFGKFSLYSTAAGTNTVQLTAAGANPADPTENLTPYVFWQSSDETVAVVSNDPQSLGLVTFLQNAPVTITASRNLFGTPLSASITVSPSAFNPVPTLASFMISPQLKRVAVGSTTPVYAIGTWSDTTTTNVTTRVTWTATDANVTFVADPNNANGVLMKVLATPAAGTVTITAVSKDNPSLTRQTQIQVSH